MKVGMSSSPISVEETGRAGIRPSGVTGFPELEPPPGPTGIGAPPPIATCFCTSTSSSACTCCAGWERGGVVDRALAIAKRSAKSQTARLPLPQRDLRVEPEYAALDQGPEHMHALVWCELEGMRSGPKAHAGIIIAQQGQQLALRVLSTATQFSIDRRDPVAGLVAGLVVAGLGRRAMCLRGVPVGSDQIVEAG